MVNTYFLDSSDEDEDAEDAESSLNRSVIDEVFDVLNSRNPYETQANVVAQAIVELASHPDRLERFRSYLVSNFGDWLYFEADTPSQMAIQLHSFAEGTHSIQ